MVVTWTQLYFTWFQEKIFQCNFLSFPTFSVQFSFKQSHSGWWCVGGTKRVQIKKLSLGTMSSQQCFFSFHSLSNSPSQAADAVYLRSFFIVIVSYFAGQYHTRGLRDPVTSPAPAPAPPSPLWSPWCHRRSFSNAWWPASGWSRGEWPGSSISLFWSALWRCMARLGSGRTGWTW